MTANRRTSEYLLKGVEVLVERGAFRNGGAFRPTQRDALDAYDEFLHSDLAPEQKLKGFFEIPTGVGKTALFLAILDEAHRIARENDDRLRVMIVVPTIPILNQMEDEVREWAPDYLETMGFFGGKHRKLGKELTVITYNSWVNLMEQGKIDSSNIDILVSDEAHRGTSERRLTNQFNAFSKGTAQIAFTATARFDKERSVELTHGYEIFSRGVGDSVRLGELAAYIQTQFHVIRIQPLDHMTWEKELDTGEVVGIRQDAWMRQMVAVLRDGSDVETGDPLTDNKSAFYVNGTDMADRMAELASADPALQARAKVQGCKCVLVAVHSKMHPLQQDAIMEAFKRGEYLGIASDEKLKEGYNYPALKNIFDFPRGSILEKAQIIGRAARQWWNDAKGRLEGATIVDSAIYFGSADPEEDEKRKQDAIRAAQQKSAWAVLNGTAVFAPGRKASAEPREPTKPGGGIAPVYGLDVTSHIDLEDLNAIYALQQKLNEGNRIVFSNEMREELRREMARAGIGTRKLLKTLDDSLDGLNEDKINSWLNSNSGIKNVDQTEWDYVLDGIRAQPDTALIPITVEMLDELRREIMRTGLGAISLFKLLFDPPEGLTDGKVNSWLSPGSGIKNVDQTEWDYVLDGIRAQPDTALIPITVEMREQLRSHMARTGLGARSLFKSLVDPPEGLNVGKIDGWLTPRSSTKNADLAEWNFVLDSVKKLPDTIAIPLTDVMRDELNREMARAGVRARSLFKLFVDPPEGLNEGKINSWLTPSSGTKKVDLAEWNFVLADLLEQPDTAIIPITVEMRDQLRSHMVRTGLGTRSLFKSLVDPPEGLNGDKIKAWLNLNSKLRNANQAEWTFVLQGAERLPDAKPKPGAGPRFPGSGP